MTAAEMFDTWYAWVNAEDTMVNALLAACSIDPETPTDWPLGDVVFDAYDGSFEFHGIATDWTPTADQLTACFALGFARCWVCYVNGTERYFSPSHMAGALKESRRGGEREGLRQMRLVKLANAKAWLEREIAHGEALVAQRERYAASVLHCVTEGYQSASALTVVCGTEVSTWDTPVRYVFPDDRSQVTCPACLHQILKEVTRERDLYQAGCEDLVKPLDAMTRERDEAVELSHATAAYVEQWRQAVISQSARAADNAKLLKRYLDNHCANSDAEGMSTLCECKLCLDTRTTLGMTVS